MQLAMVAAGFTPGEADQLRRAMAAWRRKGGLEPFEQRLMDGMRERGYPARVRRAHLPADPRLRRVRLSRVALGELRAAGLRVGWLKRHDPAAFLRRAAQQPADGLLRAGAAGAGRAAARRRGAAGRRAARASGIARWKAREPALRAPPGLRMVKGLSAGRRASASSPRAPRAPFAERRRTSPAAPRLDARDLKCLAAAGALAALADHRRRAYWDVAGVEAPAAAPARGAGRRDAAALAAPDRRRGPRRRLREPRPHARPPSARAAARRACARMRLADRRRSCARLPHGQPRARLRASSPAASARTPRAAWCS